MHGQDVQQAFERLGAMAYQRSLRVTALACAFSSCRFAGSRSTPVRILEGY